MKTLIYSVKKFEISYLINANGNKHDLTLVSDKLDSSSVHLAQGHKAISIFSADDASAEILTELKKCGINHIALRSAGYDNLDLKEAERLGFRVANVPDYSPYAVAEHAINLLLALNRKLIDSVKQTSQFDFTIDNLIGFDLHGKTIGIIGTGKIGSVIAKILDGFGCKILANDIFEDRSLTKKYDLMYCDIEKLCSESDVIILSIPLNSHTYKLIDESKLKQMKPSVLLINIARGAVVDTKAVITALDNNRITGYGTDVYDGESGVFFYNRSKNIPNDPTLKKILHHDKILLTPHQAFATCEAIENIAKSTIESFDSWENGKLSKNELTPLKLDE